mmetsp:Transcript_31233/g.73627  ORF Transcript_31233/g.73627 Transcript_31233/m.73627 type:complete len:247 (-) Transcript_31233:23-763(-)
MHRIALANMPIQRRRIDFAAAIQLTWRLAFSATTFMTTTGSINWLMCGATTKITARPSFSGASFVSPPTEISRKKVSITTNQNVHTALRKLTLSTRYKVTRSALIVCPQMGQPSIEMIKSSPTANHNRRNPYLFHIWSGRETSCACRLRLKLIPWNAAELQPSFFRNFSTFFCVCTLGAVLTAPPFSSCGWLFSLFSDATGCELPSDDPALAADALIGASMATRLVYEDLKQIGYWPSMQTSQGEG